MSAVEGRSATSTLVWLDFDIFHELHHSRGRTYREVFLDWSTRVRDPLTPVRLGTHGKVEILVEAPGFHQLAPVDTRPQ